MTRLLKKMSVLSVFVVVGYLGCGDNACADYNADIAECCKKAPED